MTVAVGTALAEQAKKPGPQLAGPGAHAMEVAYRRSIYCGDVLKQENGTLTSRYCGARWCLVCSSIRTARIWEAHGPIIDGWKRPFFVTLTRRNVTAVGLRAEIDSMLAVLKRVKESMKKTDLVSLVALRKIECTYNAGRDDYHPHFHLLVQSRQMARLLVARWLDHCGERATDKAQDARPAKKSAMAEMLKYFTKMVARSKFTDPAALDTIFCAMKSRRVYQGIGYTLPDDDGDDDEIELNESTRALTRVDEIISWEWSQTLTDWVDFVTGECLTGYSPAKAFRAFVESIA